MPDMCQTKGCEREARMAIRTTRPTRPGLESRIYYDDRDAPKTVMRYCKTCGTELTADLVRQLVAEDAS